jgi:predicted metal-binding membrane protein
MTFMPDRHRTIAAAGVILVTLLCWAWIAPMARDMYGSMSGPSAWMMTHEWTPRMLMLLWAMWAVMMGAMMLPSALPLVMMYAGFSRRREGRDDQLGVAAIIVGYLVVWAMFSVAATAAQRVLSHWVVLTPMMEMSSNAAIGATLLLAGAYQLTPWKGLCLDHCRSPLSFIMQRWRNGTAGALRMGLEHGVYCLGCCWALMLLLFAGGVMNLTVIVGLTLFVLLEKVAPFGVQISRALGVALLAVGTWFFVR